MTCRARGKTALVGWGTAVFVGLSCAPGVASAALTYPDLRALPPADVRLETQAVGGQTHNLVRFSTQVANQGEGPLELQGTKRSLLSDEIYDVKQWIYDPMRPVYDLRGPADKEPVGIFYYHPEHFHYHFDDFADYELWRKRAFDRAQARGFASGAPLFSSEKVSFCVMDSDKVGDGGVATYDSCGPQKQGISRGWADTYHWDLYGQWIDVGPTPLRDGRYVLRVVADPTNKLFESPSRADASREDRVANSAVTQIEIRGGQLVEPAATTP
jgi:lysyl oxidase